MNDSFAICREITRRAHSSFPLAFRLLPRPKRRAMEALYAFCRVTDDLADEPGELAVKRANLEQWRAALHAAFAGKFTHPIHAALQATVDCHAIPRQYLFDVIDGVAMDLEPVRFATFAELYQYCYRVASAVGLACVRVWGLRAGAAFSQSDPPAEAAGIAFQLTNILRDLGEDAARGRCYLPVDISADELLRQAREYYRRAEPLAALLSREGRAIFHVMGGTYRALLEAIERRGVHVAEPRARGAAVAQGGDFSLGVADPVGAVVTGERGSVVVIGGGLAGLAAAAELTPRGFRVAILESRQRLGGRAGSFTDPATGQLIDACQHAAMGCCTAFARFCKTVGIDRFLAPQPRLHFFTTDGRCSVFKADPWPAPFHLGRALLGAHYLSPGEKLRVGWGLAAMLREAPDADPPLRDWLLAHRQTPRTIDRFWGTVLVSALNETVDRLGFKYARKVFVEGFMQTRDGFVVHLPTVPLGRLYGAELQSWLANHGVAVRLNAGVKSLEGDGIIRQAVLRDGSTLSADWFVLAVPFERVLDLLPPTVAADPFFTRIGQLAASPITSVHLWFDRPVMALPHAVLVDGLGQWVFNRESVAVGSESGWHRLPAGVVWESPAGSRCHPESPGFYVQVVISAARTAAKMDRTELQQRIVAELGRLFPAVRQTQLLRSRVVTEHHATFSAVPGVDRWRPQQATPIANLMLAGDWTATDWPATMEGAVRSGFAAAAAIGWRTQTKP